MNKYLIVGGAFGNKGAEAMTLIIINKIREANEEAMIDMLMFSEDYVKHNEYEEKYYINGIKDSFAERLYAYGGIQKVLIRVIRKSKKNTLMNLSNKLEEYRAVIDISGFGLTSKWGVIPSLSYIYLVGAAAKRNIPVYIMPQSFGPFDYPAYFKSYIIYLMKKNLKGAKMIYAREQAGYDLLTNTLKLTNIELSPDMVMQIKKIDEQLVYKKEPTGLMIDIKSAKNIAIIPNLRNFDFGNKESILKLYKKIIQMMIDNDYHVYLIYHSIEDFEICKQLKSMFIKNNKVINIKEELSCIDYEKIIMKMNFAIASRYHSIVHAFKKGVPCIAIGWAIKYVELLNLFDQQDCVFHVDGKVEDETILEKVKLMLKTYKQRSETIKLKIDEIQKGNCLQSIDEVLGL